MPRCVPAYAVAAAAAVLAATLPIAEVTSFEGAPEDAGAGGWIGVLVLLGVAVAIVGSIVRRHGTVGAVFAAAAFTIAGMMLLAGGVLAAFGIDAIIDFWDSDAAGRPGPGRPWAILAGPATFIVLVVDLMPPRSVRER